MRATHAQHGITEIRRVGDTDKKCIPQHRDPPQLTQAEHLLIARRSESISFKLDRKHLSPKFANCISFEGGIKKLKVVGLGRHPITTPTSGKSMITKPTPKLEKRAS
uniref:Uncharacterized protein n=1 Tax=Panagrellus redivivus TaxID=6233 RepID=A0A7E4ZV96_PANRE